MTIKIHKPELKKRFLDQIQNGHFHDADELLTKALDALCEKEANSESSLNSSKPSQQIVDALMALPFANSELYIPPRQKDVLRLVNL